jgi:cytochrome P450
MDQSGFELTTCIGLLANTPPTLFWLLYYIYSDVELLSKIRNELSLAIRGEEIEPQRIMSACPYLQSAFKEVLRFHASSLSTRFVLEDVTLEEGLILRNGSVMHIPSSILHRDPLHWGNDAGIFDAARFLPVNGAAHPAEKSQAAFRPFGGGTTLCPGRHFASLEISSVAAMILWKFDIIPAKGYWNYPGETESTLTTTVLPPLHEIRVRFLRRERT